MLLTKEVTMNLSYREEPIVVDILQGDSARALTVHFLSGGVSWKMPEDATVLLQYCCADGTGGILDTLEDGTPAFSANGDTLTIMLAEQMCAVAGTTQLQVTIISDGKQISTFPVEIRVAPQVDAKAARGNYSNLQQWLNSLELIGTPGKDGYTPVKGVDYFTSTEKYEMMCGVLEMLPNLDEVSY